MQPNFEFGPELLDNTAKFSDPFFNRFTLRQAQRPLQLTDRIAKHYRFPTLYADVTCAIGIFHCSYERARAILPHPRLVPVRMPRGRALAVFSCYEYRNVMNVPPYNEIAMTIPVLAAPRLDVPVLPMLASRLFPEFGFYVFSMPVTSLENQIRGNKIWGLPKVTQAIDIQTRGGDCVTVAKDESGDPYFELRVPIRGTKTAFDVRTQLFSQLDGRMLQSETFFKASFQVTKFMTQLVTRGKPPRREYLKIGSGATATMLRQLDIEPHPFQLRFARHMNSAFDLPTPCIRLAEAPAAAAAADLQQQGA
jgi:hypothetical protein